MLLVTMYRDAAGQFHGSRHDCPGGRNEKVVTDLSGRVVYVDEVFFA